MTDSIESYKKWRDQQRCIDCGRSHEEIRGQGGGWMTEIQCYNCWRSKGAPENRGLPSAREKYLEDGGVQIW